MTQSPNTIEYPARRAALRRLGLVAAAAYIVPEVLMLSEARAASSATPPSSVSVATPPTPPTPPSNVDVDAVEADGGANDTCRKATAGDQNQSITISQSDFDRAQETVEAGYAKPLKAIWPQFSSNYSGKVIGIEFTGFRWRPRYRFKAISASGHLETVIVSARTGLIEKIIGC